MMALGSTRVLYLEQPVAVFSSNILKRGFPVLCHLVSKTQQVRGCHAVLFSEKFSKRWRGFGDLCVWAYAGRHFSISVSSSSLLLIFMDVALAYLWMGH